MSMNYDKDRAEKFTERILANPNSSQVGVIASNLLREYHRGYPVENLRSLLANHEESIVITGAWIASELGAKGTPLLADISRLIGHPQKKVRFSVIDCLLVWARPSNQTELASVIGLLSDPEAGVRWKVMDFLSRATPEQLAAAHSFFEVTEPNSGNARGLAWLIGVRATDPQEIRIALQSPEEEFRKYAVVAARRMGRVNPELLRYASSLNDPDVKNFADSSIALLDGPHVN
jgi:hypothetical protein